MEQREGAFVVSAFGAPGEGYIDVRFLLLKGTYEERIFHTVMQRDQWFQVLIGSKRRGLRSDRTKKRTKHSEDDAQQDLFLEEDERGRLTDEECSEAVMLDLAPCSIRVSATR